MGDDIYGKKEMWLESGCIYSKRPHKHLNPGTDAEYCPFKPEPEED